MVTIARTLYILLMMIDVFQQTRPLDQPFAFAIATEAL